jgi:hypothetical protein
MIKLFFISALNFSLYNKESTEKIDAMDKNLVESKPVV